MKVIRFTYVFLTFSFTQSLSLAQNVVPDSSFENYKQLPHKFVFLQEPINQYLNDWTSPVYGTPDYYHKNAIIPPFIKLPDISYPPLSFGGNTDTVKVLINPNSGNGLVGLATHHMFSDNDSFYYAEYLSTRLSHPLKKNAKYRGSFMINSIEFQSLVLKDVGLLLVKDINSMKRDSQGKHTPTLFGNDPQVLNRQEIKANAWEKTEGVFRAKGGEEYVILGYFKQPDSAELLDTTKAYIGKSDDGLRLFINYLYFDDVSLIEIPGIIGQDSACFNDAITYESSFPGPHTWYDAANTILSKDSLFTFIAKQSGWIYLSTPSGKDSIYLTVISPQVFIGTDTSFCEGESIIITATGDLNNLVWSNSSLISSIKIIHGGEYWASISMGGCVQKDTISVIEHPRPPGLVVRTYTICSANQEFATTQFDESYLYSWKQDNDSVASKELTHEGYSLIEIISDYGCKTLDSIYVSDICKPTLFIPNAFVPSGINKTFKPQFTYARAIEWRIFNRWGELVFETKDKDQSWDGTFKDEPCEGGMYFYEVHLWGTYPETEDIKRGSFVLIR